MHRIQLILPDRSWPDINTAVRLFVLGAEMSDISDIRHFDPFIG